MKLPRPGPPLPRHRPRRPGRWPLLRPRWPHGPTENVIRKTLAERFQNPPKIDEVRPAPVAGLWELHRTR